MWSCHSFEKPAKWTAEAAQNLLGIVLVVTMMNTIQLYKVYNGTLLDSVLILHIKFMFTSCPSFIVLFFQNWPFDNLCFDEESDPVVSNDRLWQSAGAVDGRIWSLCKEPSAFLLARWGLDGVGLIANPEEWMTIAHSRALKIYSVFSIIITIVLFLYYWGRNILDLAKHLFFTKAIPLRPNEDNLPTFTDGGAGMSAYVPQVHDGSFMFPMLATDLSTMDTAQHIPWVCDYDLMNFANDLGPAATAQGLPKAFSVVKRYGPIASSRPDSPDSVSLSRLSGGATTSSTDKTQMTKTRRSAQGTLEPVPESRRSIDPSSRTQDEILTLAQRGSAPAFIEPKIPSPASNTATTEVDNMKATTAATDENVSKDHKSSKTQDLYSNAAMGVTKEAATEVDKPGESQVDISIVPTDTRQEGNSGNVEVGASNSAGSVAVDAAKAEEKNAGKKYTVGVTRGAANKEELTREFPDDTSKAAADAAKEGPIE